jgi:hypothetical protein
MLCPLGMKILTPLIVASVALCASAAHAKSGDAPPLTIETFVQAAKSFSPYMQRLVAGTIEHGKIANGGEVGTPGPVPSSTHRLKGLYVTALLDEHDPVLGKLDWLRGEMWTDDPATSTSVRVVRDVDVQGPTHSPKKITATIKTTTFRRGRAPENTVEKYTEKKLRFGARESTFRSFKDGKPTANERSLHLGKLTIARTPR